MVLRHWTGSSFDMGASREGTCAVFIEPALFFAMGTLGITTGQTSFRPRESATTGPTGGWRVLHLLCSFHPSSDQAARVPVVTPIPHSSSMIHEVMI